MRIEAIEKHSKVANTRPNVRSIDAFNAQQLRARKKRQTELYQENYRDTKIDIPVALMKGGPKSGKTVNSRRVLGSKKSFANHLDDDPKSTQKFLEMAAKASRYPTRAKCTICGYLGKVKCINCNARYCSLACGASHNETRCGR